MLKEERGAVVVEATIALTTFMFAITMILSIVNICLVQAKIGVVINGIAKDISQYSYVYSMTGLNDKQAALSGNADAARKSIDGAIDEVTDVYSAMSSLSNEAAIFIKDPEMRSSLISLLKNSAAEGAKSFAAGKVLPLLAKERLTDTSGDKESYETCLAHLGVVPKGDSYLGGLDFGDSVICMNGSDEIKIIVNYKIRIVDFLGMDYKYNFTQCAATKAWIS